MNLYRYRVVERTTTTIIGDKSTKDTTYYIQQSFLGIMWADMFSKNGNLYSYRTKDEAIYAYDRLTKKETVEEKVVHPIKQIK
jgi:hypothetical protein